MPPSIDHATCSELLRAYLEGSAGENAPAVKTHLESCPDCRAELAALQLLITPVEPLSAKERTRLRAGVMSAAGSPLQARRLEPLPTARGKTARGPQSRSPISAGPLRRGQRWYAAALGAVAVLALVFAGTALFHQGSGVGTGAAASRAAGQQPNAPEPDRSVGAGNKGSLSLHSLPLPRFASPALSGVDEVESRAATQLDAFAGIYKVDQIGRLAPAFLHRLAATAPPALHDQVLNCGGRLTQSAPLLPAFGATAGDGNRSVLVLVFVSGTKQDGPVNQAWVYTSPVGACRQQLADRFALAPAGP